MGGGGTYPLIPEGGQGLWIDQNSHNKFRKKEIQLQPPREPREHRLGEVQKVEIKIYYHINFLF